jgi:hypothetical protein
MAAEILFEPFPKQLQFIKAALTGQYKYILYGGAIRGGKTYAGIGALLLLCKMYPGSKWAIVRNSLATIKRNTIPSFFKMCPQRFIKSYNQDTQTVVFTNGSQILFFAENYDDDKELNRWKGLELNGFLLEEANELQEASFYKALERAGTFIPAYGKKPKPLLLLTCNPAKNWIKTLFYDRWKEDALPDGWLYIPSKITDNPFMTQDEDYMESLKNLPKYEYCLYVEGDWDLQVKSGGEFYKSWDLQKHVGECIYDPSLPIHLSFDDNVVPFLPAGVFQLRGKQIFMINELIGRNPGNTVKSVCNDFIRQYPDHKSGLFIYGDSTSQKRSTLLEDGHNFFTMIMGYLENYKPRSRVLKSNPSVAMRGSFFNAVLEKEVFGLKFLISETCKHTISDFTLTKEAADGTKNKEMVTDPKTKARYQATSHMTDLSDYLLVSAFASDFAAYQTGGRKSQPILYGKPGALDPDRIRVGQYGVKRTSKNDYQ